MPLTSHSVDPRTGCWTAAEGVAVSEIFERTRGPVPADVILEPVCGYTECANPGHIRPVRHAVTETSVGVEPTPAVTVPAPPAKRGPGRPRKNP